MDFLKLDEGLQLTIYKLLDMAAQVGAGSYCDHGNSVAGQLPGMQ